MSCAYDAAGRRTRLTWPGTTALTIGYVYNAAGDMIEVRENPAGNNFLLASYGYDDRGRRSSLTRGNGTVTSYGYDDYGNPGGGAVNGRFGYAGQPWLPEIAMSYNRARIYNPGLGRFMQTDPIGFGGGMNLYAYVSGDPVNSIDPTGTECLIITGSRTCRRDPSTVLTGCFGGCSLGGGGGTGGGAGAFGGQGRRLPGPLPPFILYDQIPEEQTIQVTFRRTGRVVVSTVLFAGETFAYAGDILDYGLSYYPWAGRVVVATVTFRPLPRRPTLPRSPHWIESTIDISEQIRQFRAEQASREHERNEQERQSFWAHVFEIISGALGGGG